MLGGQQGRIAGPGVRMGLGELALDGAQAGVGELQVGPGFALHVEGVLELKLHIVGAAVLEVVEDHGTDAHCAGDAGTLLAGDVGVLLGHDRGGAVDGLLQHLPQEHGLPGPGPTLGPAGFQTFARLIVPHQDHAEADMAQAVGKGPAQQFGDGEPFLEMEGLTEVHDIQAAVEGEFREAVVAGGQVPGGIEGAAVGPFDQGGLLELLAGQGRQIDHCRALVLFQQALGRQFRQQGAHLVFIVGLALPRVEVHAQ